MIECLAEEWPSPNGLFLTLKSREMLQFSLQNLKNKSEFLILFFSRVVKNFGIVHRGGGGAVDGVGAAISSYF